MASFVLLGLILYLSQRSILKIERRILTAGLRGFIQLLLLSMILAYIFSIKSIILQILILGIMITFGAKTASDRLDKIQGVFRIELISLSIAVYSIMGLISLIGAIPIDDPKIWIPIGGMAAGNGMGFNLIFVKFKIMNISYLTLNRIRDDLINRKDQIESSLSLGLSPMESLNELQIISKAMVVGEYICRCT